MSPESRHLRPAMKFLSDVLGGTLTRHPREKRPSEGHARWSSKRVEMLGGTPEGRWKFGEGRVHE